ncbi:uncharacterized protein B0I36DRAFT_336329 [Microdochium trichocladiopsis]|uniref:PD-(D/E)XK nuclease-like domain-containing protein n=1 Tax=Microdochium trichocladiopsis TaxID=1682393 RepID=A0A9P8XVU6_9PEZI|nr:uncharacterized protein B0I36DRAFT_336329 [Microdochium trichocladiopsis]KAH7016011.1 hypothetical protein B0I36DRAFT_336329 [Microdochium trichocladiopsis]
MYASRAAIQRWLPGRRGATDNNGNTNTPPNTAAVSHGRKRRTRHRHSSYPSPDPSSDMPASKRRAEDHDRDDLSNNDDYRDAVDECEPEAQTPRGPTRKSAVMTTAFISDTSSTTTRTTDSRASSLSKRARNTQQLLTSASIAFASLSAAEPAPPPRLSKLVDQLKNLDADRHFVWPQVRAAVEERAQSDQRFKQLARSIWYAPGIEGQDDELQPVRGPPPSVEMLGDILDDSADCAAWMDPEPSWNDAVHWQMLRQAVVKDPQFRATLRVSNCTTATIRAAFSHQSAAGLATASVGILGTANAKLGAVAASTNTSTSTSKKVDYCVTILDRGDARIAQLVKAGVLLNHTAFEPYTKTPIGLSIETKARKADEDEALAQIGVWISAQYQCLQDLIQRSMPSLEQAQAAWRTALKELEFLPGVVVLKHLWFFVAATRPAPERPDTLVWHRVYMGSTETPEGVC